MFNLHLSAEQLEIRDTVRDFVTGEVKPVTLKSDRLDRCDHTLPMDVLDQASQMGLRTLPSRRTMAAPAPTRSPPSSSRKNWPPAIADVAATLTETGRLGHILFDQLMNHEQRERFLSPSSRMTDITLALAVQEPDAGHRTRHQLSPPGGGGSPPQDHGRARRQPRMGSQWHQDLRRQWTGRATCLRSLVTTDPAAGRHGVSTILVPRDTPGLTIREPNGGLRWHHGGVAELIFQDCRVPAENLLGAEGSGKRAGRPATGRISRR
jgi:short-chain 2-methylacyl-CoA dehydrogenase